jgi:hypothetical protein
MELGRCLRLVPVAMLVVAGVSALGGSPLLAAGARPWTPVACVDGGAPPGGTSGSTSDSTWYRLDPTLDASGTLRGQRLLTGADGVQTRALTLAPEAFASGPVGGRVISGSDDGLASVLRAIDPARGCATRIGREREVVVRSAIATPDGRALYEHRVDRATRSDLGVWRRALAGWTTVGRARQVLEPLPPDSRYGPVFTTDLRLAADGSLLVSSCGPRVCRDRVLDALGIVTITGPTGPAIGLADGQLVTWAACAGTPCPIVAHGPDGSSAVVEDGALGAVVGGTDGSVLVVDTGKNSVRSIDLRSGRSVSEGGGGLQPVGGGSLATSGASSALGEVVLAPHGRVADPSRVERMFPAVPEVVP